MDVLSHALYANLVFSSLPLEQRCFATFFGVMPDLISFGTLNFRHFFQKTMHYSDPPKAAFSTRIFYLYHLTHSLLIWFAIFAILLLLPFPFAALVWCGWLLHIILDMPTHSTGFFPTLVLWPLSKFHFSGINWSNKWFMIGNYALVAILYFLYYF